MEVDLRQSQIRWEKDSEIHQENAKNARKYGEHEDLITNCETLKNTIEIDWKAIINLVTLFRL
eukprot:140361-Hanusia_phi.AAC.4